MSAPREETEAILRLAYCGSSSTNKYQAVNRRCFFSIPRKLLSPLTEADGAILPADETPFGEEQMPECGLPSACLAVMTSGMNSALRHDREGWVGSRFAHGSGACSPREGGTSRLSLERDFLPLFGGAVDAVDGPRHLQRL